MKRILTVLASLLILLVFGLLLFGFFFNAQIEAKVAKQVAERSENKLSFSNTELSFFSSFPNISCRLSDINIQSLAQAEHLDVHIGLMSALMRKPVITNATLRNATIELVKDEKGWNYKNLFETQPSATNQSADIALELKNTILDNITVKMIDNGKLWAIGNIKEASVDVKIQDGITDLVLDGSLQVSSKDIDTTAYSDVYLEMKHTLLDNSNTITFQNTHIQNAIFLEGIFDLGVSGSDTQLGIRIDDLEVEDIIGYLPVSYRDVIIDRDISGSANGDLVFQNKILKTENLQIDLGNTQLRCKGEYNVTNRILSDIDISGDLSGDIIPIMLPDSTQVKGKGNLEIESLQVPQWNLNAERQNNTNDLLLKGKFDGFAIAIQDSEWIECSSGDFTMKGPRYTMDNIVISHGSSSLNLNGNINIETGKEIDIRIKSKYLDVAEIWATAKRTGLISSSSSEQKQKHIFNYEGTITTHIEELVFEDIEVEEIHSNVELEYEQIDFDAKGSAFSGQVEMDGILDLYRGIHLETDIITKGIQISTCLEQCKNFGQAFITSENMMGEVNSVGFYNFYWNDNFEYLEDDTRVLISTKVNDGELNNLEMMKKFSTFIKSKDLERIKFTSLQNYIEIDGRDLYIPTMFIQSNASNFTLNGVHSIDHRILYNIQVNAGQVMMNKWKKHDPSLKPQPAQKGWFNLYYQITGTTDAFNYERNKRLVKASFSRELLRKERIYQALLDRFGYLEDLKPPADWSSIPEYELN